MSVVSCQLQRIEVESTHIPAVLTELALLETFEPVTPLFPIEATTQGVLLGEIQHKKEIIHKAVSALSQLPELPQQKKASSNKLDSKTAQQIQSDYPLLLKAGREVSKQLQLQAELLKNIQEARVQLEKLEPFKEVAAPLFANHELLKTNIIAVEALHYEKVSRELSKITELQQFIVAQTPELFFIAIVYTTEIAASLSTITQQSFCKEITIETSLLNNFSREKSKSRSSSTAPQHSPARLYADYTAFIAKKQQELSTVAAHLNTLAQKHLQQLGLAYDLLSLQEQSLQLIQFVGHTPGSDVNTRELSSEHATQLQEKIAHKDSVVSGLAEQTLVHIDGWIDPQHTQQLAQRLLKLGVGAQLTQLDAEADPQLRTSLRNNKLFRPFELITTLMGTPSKTELDPSAYVAPFFVLFFGFALGDAVYGLLMVALSVYFSRKKEEYSVQLQNALDLILYCGISTVFFGALTGGWMGFDLNAIGGIGTALAKLKVIDMQSNILLLLIFSLTLGYIHQLFGLALSFKSMWQAEEKSKALQVPGTWLLFFVGLTLVLALQNVAGLGHLAYLARPLLYTIIIIFALGQGYGSVWWMRPFKGLLSFLNLTSYLSNTLSYARLLALGLATGVIASVVNMIAVMAGGSLHPLIGVPIILAVGIFGHTFNIVLNLLGTFINVARLHLVEFFPQFFEAKGIGLTPVAAQPAYSQFSSSLTAKDIVYETVEKESK